MLLNGSASTDDSPPTGRLSRRRLLRIGAVGALGSTAAAALAACGEGEPRIVTKEVPVEKTVVKEIPIETIVTQTEIKEVPVEKIVTQTVIKEVPVDRVVEKVVTVEKMMAPEQQSVTVYSGRSAGADEIIIDQPRPDRYRTVERIASEVIGPSR